MFIQPPNSSAYLLFHHLHHFDTVYFYLLDIILCYFGHCDLLSLLVNYINGMILAILIIFMLIVYFTSYLACYLFLYCELSEIVLLMCVCVRARVWRARVCAYMCFSGFKIFHCCMTFRICFICCHEFKYVCCICICSSLFDIFQIGRRL